MPTISNIGSIGGRRRRIFSSSRFSCSEKSSLALFDVLRLCDAFLTVNILSDTSRDFVWSLSSGSVPPRLICDQLQIPWLTDSKRMMVDSGTMICESVFGSRRFCRMLPCCSCNRRFWTSRRRFTIPSLFVRIILVEAEPDRIRLGPVLWPWTSRLDRWRYIATAAVEWSLLPVELNVVLVSDDRALSFLAMSSGLARVAGFRCHRWWCWWRSQLAKCALRGSVFASPSPVAVTNHKRSTVVETARAITQPILCSWRGFHIH